MFLDTPQYECGQLVDVLGWPRCFRSFAARETLSGVAAASWVVFARAVSGVDDVDQITDLQLQLVGEG